jgi:hypothetical protein
MDAISEIVGECDLGDGERAQVYRALRRLLCAKCAAEIAEETLFTRHGVKGVGLSIMPQCRKCAPFTLRQGKKEKSALLEALLGEKAAGPANLSPTPAPEELREAEAKVAERLGPALKRGRHKLK